MALFRAKHICTYLLFSIFLSTVYTQTIYSPQVLYDAPGGLFEQDSLRTLSLNFYHPLYNMLLHDGWVNETGLRLPATLSMNGVVYDSVAVRYKGNSTYYWAENFDSPKVPYNIDMNDIVSGQNLMGYKKVKLANALFDPTFVRETIGYNIYREYMPSPEASLVRLEVQGDYLGVYVNTESIDKTFLKKHFGEKDGVLFKCDPTAQYGSGAPWTPSNLRWYGTDSTLYYDRYDLKSDAGWSDLLGLIDTLNNHPASIDSVLNVDRVLWYHALNTILPNSDAYNTLVRHNYYLYKTQDGLFQVLPWDLSECFINGMIEWLDHPDSIYFYDPYQGYAPFDPDKPLVYRLLNIPTYHKQYTAHLRTILEEFFATPDSVQDMADALQSLAYPAVAADPNKWFSMLQFEDNLAHEIITFGELRAGIISTIEKRVPYLNAHPEISKVPPTIASVGQSSPAPIPGEMVYITAEVSNATQVELRVTKSQYASKFSSIDMLDDGTFGDAVAGDGIYTGLIPYRVLGDEVSYYIRAQNTDAMALSPVRAEYEYYFYSLAPPAGIPSSFSQLDFEVFPNPATQYTQVEVAKGSIQSIELTDLSGKSVLTFSQINRPFYSLDLSELSSGSYWLRVRSTTGKTGSKMLFHLRE